MTWNRGESLRKNTRAISVLQKPPETNPDLQKPRVEKKYYSREMSRTIMGLQRYPAPAVFHRIGRGGPLTPPPPPLTVGAELAKIGTFATDAQHALELRKSLTI